MECSKIGRSMCILEFSYDFTNSIKLTADCTKWDKSFSEMGDSYGCLVPENKPIYNPWENPTNKTSEFVYNRLVQTFELSKGVVCNYVYIYMLYSGLWNDFFNKTGN